MKTALPASVDLRTSAAPSSRVPVITRRRLLTAAGGLTFLAGSGTAAYATSIEAQELLVTDYRLTPPGWRPDAALTIGVISDLHAGGPNMGRQRIATVVEATNRLGCDLVVLLGDFFATHRFVTEHVPHDVWASELSRLSAPLGVYAILGNHDWWHDTGAARAALEQVRIPVLENDVVQLRTGRGRFWLAGLGDQLAFPLGRGRYLGVDDLPGTLRRITTDDPVVLVAHEPDIFPRVPDRVSLTLAGHTHGGQIRIPLLWPSWVPSRYGARYAYGHIVEGGRHMIVSGGLGTAFVPARLGVPPEILRVSLGSGATSEHDPEKWEPVFGKDHAQTKT